MDVWYLSGRARASVRMFTVYHIRYITILSIGYLYIWCVFFSRTPLYCSVIPSLLGFVSSLKAIRSKPCTGTMSTMLKREMCIAYAYNSPHDKHQPNAPVAQKSEQTNRKGIPREGNKSLGILFLCQQFHLKYTHFFRSMSLSSLQLALHAGYGALPVAAEQRAGFFFYVMPKLEFWCTHIVSTISLIFMYCMYCTIEIKSIGSIKDTSKGFEHVVPKQPTKQCEST